MIHGHKPSGYTVTQDESGCRIEGETRQCVHCQFTWIYQPGSGDRRGWCLNCNGFVCAREECMKEQAQRIDEWLRLTSKVRNCIPFEEWNDRLKEKVLHRLPLEPGMTVTSSGLIVPRSWT